MKWVHFSHALGFSDFGLNFVPNEGLWRDINDSKILPWAYVRVSKNDFSVLLVSGLGMDLDSGLRIGFGVVEFQDF